MKSRWIALLAALCSLTASCAANPEIISSVAAGSTAQETDVVAAMSRDAAIETLIANAFLPEDTAACVIDAVFLETGIYNPAGADVGVVDECTTLIEDIEGDTAYTAVIDDPRQRPAVSIGPVELTSETMPVLNPGGRATGIVDIGGTLVEYVAITPPGFTIGDSAPVFFALPPGGQDLEITDAVADVVYQDQAVARGWVVVTPASPNGRWYENDNGRVAAEFLAWVHAWVDAEGGRVHLGGMSNGGLSAFHLASRMPGAFHSLLGFPGYPRNVDQGAIENLVNVPVRLWVGSEDPGWLENMEDTAADLRTVGGDVELFVLPGEPHVLQSTANGVAFFDELDAAR